MPLDWYRETARHGRELPDYPNGVMGLSIAETARSNGIRVLVSGTGGDEWAGGSRLYYAEAIAEWRGRELLAMARRDAQEAGWVTALEWFLRHGLFHVLPGSMQRGLRSMMAQVRGRGPGLGQPASWLAPALQQRLAQRREQFELESPSGWQRIGQRRQQLNLADPYGILCREMGDRQASSLGLEWRQPFWNAQIIQCAFATPTHLHFRGRENKWLHRRALAGLLPEQVLRRQSKAEFSVTFSRYRAELGPHLTEDVLPRRTDWVNPQLGRALVQAWGQNDPSDWPEIAMWVPWTLFALDSVADGDRDSLSRKTESLARS
jgi:asparagine synthase (glutamine-hydrolysing)